MKRENQKKNKILKRIAVISAAAAILAVSMAGAVVCGFFDRMHTGTTEDADTLQQTEETTDPLQLMTEVVKQKEAGADGGKSTFTILEIVPDTTYAMIGYLISGKEPIGTFGMDALSNSITGSTNGRYTTYLTTPHIGNAGDVRAVVRSWGTYTGYFEKVTSGEGLYAISTSESTEYDYLPVTAGDGEFKATIKYYVPKDDRPTEDTWEHVLLKYTVNNYDISFKNQTTQTSNTVYYKVDTVTENKGSGYYSFDDTEQIYVYDTTGKSDYDVTFVTTDWNTSGVKNYVVDAISYNPKEGAYCAYIDPDQWIEKTAAVTDTTDYNYQYAISNICMVSKLCKDNFSNTGNFDYVWHDDNSLSLECTTESDFEDGGNIYLYDYLKSKTINNEMFKLFCLAIDGADGENGIHTYDPYNSGSYIQQNVDAVAAYDSTEEINVVTLTPAQLRQGNNEAYLDSADLIYIASKAEDSAAGGSTMYSIVYDTEIPTTDFSAANDITFAEAVKIYKRVVVDQDVAIATSYSVRTKTSSATQNSTNLKKLYYMLYNFNNVENGTETLFAGRNLFTDLLPSIAGTSDAYSYDLFSIPTDEGGRINTTSYAHVDESSGTYIWGDDLTYVSRVINNETKEDTWSSGSLSIWNDSLDVMLLRYIQTNTTDLYSYYCETNSFTTNWGNINSYPIYYNQLVFNDTSYILVYSKYGGEGLSWIHEILQHKKTKSYLTVNITNWDSVNLGSTNKVIYLNEYDLDAASSIPITYEIKTPHTITNISIYKQTGTGTSAVRTLLSDSLTAAATGEENTYSGTYSVSTSDFTSGGVAGVYVIKATNSRAIEGEDTVTIVVRDLFDLN